MDKFIKGVFKKCIFSSSNGFLIGTLNLKETNVDDLVDFIGEEFTFTGFFNELNVNESYIMYGNVIHNKKYGIQFNTVKYDRILPLEKDGLVAFLSSDIFNKVGIKTAKKIVEYLGCDCLKLIIQDYNNLLIVPKMTEKMAISIRNNLLKYNESFDMIVFLTDFGFNMSDSIKIYNYYKDKTKDTVLNNIYDLIYNIDSINFNKVDSLREKTNIKIDDETRILALILNIMENLCFSLGDTYLSLNYIYSSFLKIYDNELSLDSFSFYLNKLNKMGKIIIDDDKYSLAFYYKNELYISSFVYLLANKEKEKIKNIEVKIEKLEHKFNIFYNDEQKKAIKEALENNFSIITGGPGTGKTTIIKAICELFKIISGYSYEKLEEKLILLAPTGRAAKRMSEACLFPSYTIHRYLRWNKENNSFGLNENNKSKAEFIIVDEVSMIDTNLLCNLFKALAKNIKIVFIGDYNQLESVAPGNVLKDLIDSDIVNTIFLKEIYRQEANSYITSFAYEINSGELSESFLNKKHDYNFIKCIDDDILKLTCQVVKKALDKNYSMQDIEVLAPIYKGINGIDNLNKYLQSIFNPKSNNKNEIIYGNIIYRENDKVLQLENMPDNNVFNGDIGFITKIDGDEITIDFDGNVVKYKRKDLNMIKHGYAISIHKAQGSEFKIVIMPVSISYKMMFYRKIIYTAVSRAKRSLTLIGDPMFFSNSVYKNVNKVRNTNLKKLILDNIK